MIKISFCPQQFSIENCKIAVFGEAVLLRRALLFQSTEKMFFPLEKFLLLPINVAFPVDFA